MSLLQIIVGVVVLIGITLVWANAAKGVDRPRHFVDKDLDGAPDATDHEKEEAIRLFRENQARLHPEDHKPHQAPPL